MRRAGAPAKHRTDLGFEPVDTGRRDAQLWCLVRGQAAARKLAIPRSIDCALCRIDVEPQSLFQELRNARQHPRAGRFAANVDVAVVRIAAERVTAAFQFPVQIRQQNVRPQRTQRTTLRRALRTRRYHAGCNACWFNRSVSVGIPSVRTPPCGLAWRCPPGELPAGCTSPPAAWP